MGGKSSAPTTTTQINKVELPAWVDKASQNNYAEAERLAAVDQPDYGGQRVADFGDATTGAWDWFNKVGMQAGDTQRNQATGVANELAGFQPDKITASTVDPSLWTDMDINSYLNPFIDNVEKRTLDTMTRANESALNSNANRAVAASSFGGSRSAIENALTNSEFGRNAGNMSATLRKAGWDAAAGLASGDVDRINRGGEFNANAQNTAAANNQQAGIQGAGIRGAAGDDLRGLATDQESAAFRDYAIKQGIGAQQDARSQAVLDQQYEDWKWQQEEPERDLNMRLAALGMSPYGKTETQTKTTPGQKSSTDWASVGLGGLQALGSLFAFSDDDAKVDKQKIGELDNGLGVHAFRYKGDPKSYPKTIGLMASEVEKVKPSAVKRMPGKKGKRIVNYTNAMGW